MKNFINKKNTYLLVLLVLCLLGIAIIPTYAKFADSYTTADDVVGMSLTFNLGITNIEEYEEIIVPAGETEKFNVEISNITGATVYYGIWYMMVSPKELNSDIEIARLKGTDVTTSGAIENAGTVTATIVIMNNSSMEMKINIGVASSTNSTSDIEYLGGKRLIVGDIELFEPNVPNLDNGNLIPVYYDEVEENWKKADSTNVDNKWYNYDEKKWANAILVSDDIARANYKSASEDVIITESDITAFYVWIPRYKYRVWNINRQVGDESTYAYSAYTKGIEINWENSIQSTGNVTCSYNITSSESSDVLSDVCHYGGVEITVDSENSDYSEAWYTHPAFTFGDQSITGFWFGKFDTSGNSSLPTILPDVAALTSLSISNQFTASKVFQTYGLSDNVDAHMATNLEWGAVAYLAHSNYGLCDDSSCRDVYINNSSSKYTGRSGGDLSGSDKLNLSTVYSNATVATKYSSTGYYDYKGYFFDYNGVLTDTNDVSKIASTTGNITGVYDMSGGAEEYVMGSITYETMLKPENSDTNWNGSTSLESKYYTIYSSGDSFSSQSAYNRARLGDATAEVMGGSSAWKPGIGITEVTGEFVYHGHPWFIRGGEYSNLDSGMFYFSWNEGVELSNATFRSVLS